MGVSRQGCALSCRIVALVHSLIQVLCHSSLFLWRYGKWSSTFSLDGISSWYQKLDSKLASSPKVSLAYSSQQVPRLRIILAIARRSAHRLEVYRAGFVEVSRPGSRPLAQRAKLLKAYRSRWESLRWTGVTHLPPRFMWICHRVGNELAYTHAHDATVIKHLRLPSGGTLPNSWEDDRLDLEHGIKTFSVHPEKNLLVVLEGWFDDGRWVTCLGDHTHLIHSSNQWNIRLHSVPRVKLHVERLDSTRDTVLPHNGQLE